MNKHTTPAKRPRNFSLFTLRFSLILYFLFFIFHSSFSQNNPDIKRTMHWYFGGYAGLDFSSGSPVAVNDGQTNIESATLSVSDTSGTLLFYSDGYYIWNRNHQLMPNSPLWSGLYGVGWTDQVVAVPQPGQENIYYIFRWEYANAAHTAASLVYALVDMNEDGGLGDVISKSNIIADNLARKIAAVKHKNGRDIWIVANMSQTDSFYAYLLTEDGLDTIPVVSNVGVTDVTGNGCIKFSPDGRKMAVTFNLRGPEILDFDNSSGLITNPVAFPSCYCYSYGIEFSPDNSKLYTTYHYYHTPEPYGNAIYQISLDGDSSEIIQSKFLIDTMETTNYKQDERMAIQRALDGKLYLTKYSTSKLAVINYPNLPCPACDFVDSAVYLYGGKSYDGLPSFIVNYFGNDTATEIPETMNPEGTMKIYPNPFGSSATIEITDFGGSQDEIVVEMFDVMDRHYQTNYTVLSQSGQNLKLLLERGSLKAGLYILRINTGQKTYSQKIIITD
ncbi:MAG: T9SS type A sorting domain-containing protein [Bacteroidetes bacterium]|nr:T9SS type A sorting domain-containing protein [Bacteroidota bacterium]